MFVFFVGTGLNLILFVFLLHYYLIHIIVKVLILRVSVNHSPSLLPQLSHQFENRNFIFFINNFLAQTHCYECACPSNSCTAMDNWRFTFLKMSQKLFDQKVNGFLWSLNGSVSIRPTCNLIMSKNGFKIIVGIFEMEFPDSEIFLFWLWLHLNFVLFFDHFSPLSFLVGPVTITLFPIFLN